MTLALLQPKLTKTVTTGTVQASRNHYIDSIWVYGSSLGENSTLKIERLSDDGESTFVEANQFPATVLTLERGHANKDFSYPVMRNAVNHQGQHIDNVFLPWCTIAHGSRGAMFRVTIGGTIPDDANVNVIFNLVDKYYLG